MMDGWQQDRVGQGGVAGSVFSRMKIATRLGIAFGVVLATFAGTTAFAVWQMSQMQTDMDAALEASADMSGRAGALRVSIGDIYTNALHLVISTQADDVLFYKSEIDKAEAAYMQSKKALTELARVDDDTAPVMANLKKIGDAEELLPDLATTVGRQVTAAKAAGAGAVMEADAAMVSHLTGSLKSQIDVWVRSVDDIVTGTADLSKERQRRAVETATVARRVQIGAAGVALLLGALAAWLIGRNVSRPIRDAVDVAERVARGELNTEIPHGGQDETGALLEALRKMQASLHSLVSEVRDTAGSIEVASAEVAAGNVDLSQRTENAASQLQRTASSMEQLSGAVRQSADSAQMADGLARSAATAAQRGGTLMEQVVQSMQAISKQSSHIAEIIGTIDSIAFQTNILALNAAVEAARAGEQGRGFAVVASEVRALAQRSALAAKDIKSLIAASTQSVEGGSRLVTDAGLTMQEIVASVQKVTTSIEDISRSSASQSDDIGQVGAAMNDIDQLTQQNAALVEQSAAAAESLKGQAQRLASLVGTFELGHSGSRTRPQAYYEEATEAA